MSMSPLARVWEEERERTVEEWNLRMERLNSTEFGQPVWPVAAPPSKTNSILSNYGRRNPPTYSSSSPRPPSNFERWIHKKNFNSIGSISDEPEFRIPKSEIKDIQNAFQICDRNVYGFLDIEGLKKFMGIRGTPMSHSTAKKLLSLIDPQNPRYISYDQMMYLVVHSGISTKHEIPMTSDNFNKIIQRMRAAERRSLKLEKKQPIINEYPYTSLNNISCPKCSGGKIVKMQDEEETMMNHPRFRRSVKPSPSCIIQTPINIEGSWNFFEEMAVEVEKKKQEKHLYEEYRRELRGKPGGESISMILDEEESDTRKNNFKISPTESGEIEASQLDFSILRRDWESRICSDDSGALITPRSAQSATDPPAPATVCTNPSSVDKSSNTPQSQPSNRSTPAGLSPAQFKVPGKPQPFVVTQKELLSQMDKIKRKKTEVLFRGVGSQKNSTEELP